MDNPYGLEPRSHYLQPPKLSLKVLRGEHVGSEVPYRCIRCRNCSQCRQGETLEPASLKEEQEQFLVDQSVVFDPVKGYLIACAFYC